jgi:hypothetical protein
VQKFWNDILFGLAFGIGFLVAYAVIRAVVSLLSGAGLPHDAKF